MKGIKARGYQKECLAEIAETVEAGGKRALVVMASGLGTQNDNIHHRAGCSHCSQRLLPYKPPHNDGIHRIVG